MGTGPIATENAIWRLWLATPVLIAVATLATAVTESVVLTVGVAAGGLIAFAVLRDRCDEVRREHRPLRRVLLTGAETAGVAVFAAALMFLFGVLALGAACELGADCSWGPN